MRLNKSQKFNKHRISVESAYAQRKCMWCKQKNCPHQRRIHAAWKESGHSADSDLNKFVVELSRLHTVQS